MTVEEKYIEMLTDIDNRAKSNTHRLDRLEVLAEEIHAQGKTLAVMCTQLETQGKTLTTLTDRVSALEKRPGAMWDKLIGGIVGAIASGIVAAVLAIILK